MCFSQRTVLCQDNCGSVTPGVLRSFLPHVSENLKGFSLGLSYSITDEDIFTFLGQLPNLEHLRLRNYWVSLAALGLNPAPLLIGRVPANEASDAQTRLTQIEVLYGRIWRFSHYVPRGRKVLCMDTKNDLRFANSDSSRYF